MDFNVILGTAFAALVSFYLIRALATPLREVGRVFLRTAVAAFGIWAVNVLGALFGFHIGLNLVSALVIGVLGIPGAGLLLAVKYFL
jgi:inhibitor of the pro-sigma K processing machinery